MRKAAKADLDYIMTLEYAPQNVDFIMPFPAETHEKVLSGNHDNAMDIIVVEKKSGEPVGYLLVQGLKELGGRVYEWSHIIIDKKGVGYGHETMKLIKAWSFAVRRAHRLWVDCKDWNERALHLYESEGLQREGLHREALFANGKYDNLVVLAMLEDEYRERCRRGLEFTVVAKH